MSDLRLIVVENKFFVPKKKLVLPVVLLQSTSYSLPLTICFAQQYIWYCKCFFTQATSPLVKYKRRRNVIRGNVRDIAKILLKLREIYKKFQTLDMFNVSHFEAVTRAVRDCGFCPDRKIFKQSCLGMGRALKKLAGRLALPGVSSADIHIRCQEFLLRFEAEWGEQVGQPTCNDMATMRSSSDLNLPSTEDVKLFGRETTTRLEFSIKLFEAEKSYHHYRHSCTQLTNFH